jgi:hypothetical protein
VTVPETVRSGLRERLWAEADRLDWMHLRLPDKTVQYQAWTRDPQIGGTLERYMDQRRIRTYLKDTIMKGYARSRLADQVRPLRVLGLDGVRIEARYERPHGCRLADGRVVAWGRAPDWKGILMSVHERAYEDGSHPYGAVLMDAGGRYAEDSTRALVSAAADGLKIPKLVWLAT